MIDFSRAALTHFCVHYVGNKSLGEELSLSKKMHSFKDDFVRDSVLRYFLSPFKTDVYHEFQKKHSVAQACDALFKGHSAASAEKRDQFVELSRGLASHLYDQSVHARIKGGEFYLCYFTNAMVDGELCDAIGIFKTENKENFLKVEQHVGSFDIDCETGISLDKLDKGCLVFNTDRKNGYKISIVDTNNRIAECALYWESDFLGATLKKNAYYHTSNFLDTSRGFCEEMLTEANNVNRQDQQMMLNKSTAYFKDRDRFTMGEFEKEVLVQPEVIEAFRDYREDHNKRLDRTAIDEFDVSPTAVKKNQKYMRSVVKLDRNFHIYIHAKHEFVERGYDEERGLKYYKLYYVNEE
jgi:hypothetical protein